MLTIALIFLAAPLMLLTLFFSVEIVAGLPRATKTASLLCSEPSAIIVIPAHNEEAIIARTADSVQRVLGTNMRVLVVAHNCTDGTHEKARGVGVSVISLDDAARRGKGYALNFAFEVLRPDPPEVFVVVDADCRIDRESLRALVETAAKDNRPCQAVYLLRPDRSAAPLVQISAFAFMVRNLIRQRGLQRVSGRVHLTGTGMAVPYRLLSRSLLESGDIVEDLSLGLDMGMRGYPPQLVTNALVTSKAADDSGTLVQRRRWEGGFLATSLRRSPGLLIDAFRRADRHAFFAALDLMVPPVALLTVLNLCALVLTTVLVIALDLSWIAVWFEMLVFVLAVMAIVAAWIKEGREFVSLAALVRAPVYVIWKLPLYLSLALHGAPREWLRTGR